MAIIRNSEQIISWVLVSSKFDFSDYEMRIRYAIINRLQEIIDSDKAGSGVSLSAPTDLFGLKYMEIRMSECLRNDSDENYTQVRRALHALNDKSMEVEINGVWRVIRLIQLPKHVSHTGIISFYLDDIIFDALLQYTKQYRLIDTKLAMSFHSVYTMRLYEIINHQKNPITYHLSSLRKLFNLEEKYKQNRDFLKRTLDIAKKELDVSSPWTFDYEPVYDGRRIDSIKLIPKWNRSNDDKHKQQQEWLVHIKTKGFYDCYLISKLRNTYKFSDIELKHNKNKISYFHDHFTIKEQQAFFQRINDNKTAKNIKAYIMGCIKKENYKYWKAHKE